jgi:hypothetical protein
MHERDPERTSMIMDLPWLIQGHLNWVQSLMFFQVNVSKYFTHRYLVKQVGHTLLDMIQEEDK